MVFILSLEQFLKKLQQYKTFFQMEMFIPQKTFVLILNPPRIPAKNNRASDNASLKRRK